MSPIQAAALVFALAMAYLTYVGFRRRHFGPGGLVMWQAIWFGLALVSIVPQLFQWIIKPLHVARLMDLVVIAGMLVLGAITYRNYASVQRLQDQVERFVREQALSTMEAPGAIIRSDLPQGPGVSAAAGERGESSAKATEI
jgi:hypothetical protein